MKILIINPPYVIGADRKTIFPGKAMLPVGPLSIASGLQAKGCEVEFVDLVFMRNWIGEVSSIALGCFDQVLICCHTVRNIPVVRILTQLIRRLGFRGDITLGGNITNQLAVNDFSKLGIEVDSVVRKYGHGAIDGILALEKGDIVSPALSELPVPDLTLLPNAVFKLYLDHSEGRYPIVGPGGFGCLWHERCIYCDAQNGVSSTPRFIENIFMEIEQAIRFGYQEFWCVDNLVNVFPETFLEFDNELHKRGCTWSGMTRPELIVKQGENVFFKIGCR